MQQVVCRLHRAHLCWWQWGGRLHVRIPDNDLRPARAGAWDRVSAV